MNSQLKLNYSYKLLKSLKVYNKKSYYHNFKMISSSSSSSLPSSSSIKFLLNEEIMLKLYDRIKENNNINNSNLVNDYIKWIINNKVYGYLKPEFANEI